ncbi:hypothetical protein LLE49_04865 [Alicyclobacillus tolerans]|uniref:hypothetical protein n=1 Tax=Alicyclobacillus tolerans TaxID=90970 RepID=UPI001F30051F|nr:hypothetical protein [Alicyclobacillus tolerans]MCF8564069.1 hypothetical protein [Alicyclobacillus tolerans]
MRLHIGDCVTHPVSKQSGTVRSVHQNPACLLRSLIVEWEDGEVEEIDELDFGPLDDE